MIIGTIIGIMMLKNKMTASGTWSGSIAPPFELNNSGASTRRRAPFVLVATSNQISFVYLSIITLVPLLLLLSPGLTGEITDDDSTEIKRRFLRVVTEVTIPRRLRY